MIESLPLLVATTVSIGFIHTILGPDHYIPFVAMSEARQWTTRKTLAVTAKCGLGHVVGSALLGIACVALGTAFTRTQAVESIRGDIAAGGLIAFGLIYFAISLDRIRRNRGAQASSPNGCGDRLLSTHSPHEPLTTGKRNCGVSWTLFLLFVFGPCEPLIPLLVFPAATMTSFVDRVFMVFTVVIAFGLSTVMTMTLCVMLIKLGFERLDTQRLQIYSHPAAGLALLACGLLIKIGF